MNETLRRPMIGFLWSERVYRAENVPCFAQAHYFTREQGFYRWQPSGFVHPTTPIQAADREPSRLSITSTLTHPVPPMYGVR